MDFMAVDSPRANAAGQDQKSQEAYQNAIVTIQNLDDVSKRMLAAIQISIWVGLQHISNTRLPQTKKLTANLILRALAAVRRVIDIQRPGFIHTLFSTLYYSMIPLSLRWRSDASIPHDPLSILSFIIIRLIIRVLYLQAQNTSLNLRGAIEAETLFSEGIPNLLDEVNTIYCDVEKSEAPNGYQPLCGVRTKERSLKILTDIIQHPYSIQLSHDFRNSLGIFSILRPATFDVSFLNQVYVAETRATTQQKNSKAQPEDQAQASSLLSQDSEHEIGTESQRKRGLDTSGSGVPHQRKMGPRFAPGEDVNGQDAVMQASFNTNAGREELKLIFATCPYKRELQLVQYALIPTILEHGVLKATVDPDGFPTLKLNPPSDDLYQRLGEILQSICKDKACLQELITFLDPQWPLLLQSSMDDIWSNTLFSILRVAMMVESKTPHWSRDAITAFKASTAQTIVGAFKTLLLDHQLASHFHDTVTSGWNLWANNCAFAQLFTFDKFNTTVFKLPISPNDIALLKRLEVFAVEVLGECIEQETMTDEEMHNMMLSIAQKAGVGVPDKAGYLRCGLGAALDASYAPLVSMEIVSCTTIRGFAACATTYILNAPVTSDLNIAQMKVFGEHWAHTLDSHGNIEALQQEIAEYDYSCPIQIEFASMFLDVNQCYPRSKQSQKAHDTKLTLQLLQLFSANAALSRQLLDMQRRFAKQCLVNQNLSLGMFGSHETEGMVREKEHALVKQVSVIMAPLWEQILQMDGLTDNNLALFMALRIALAQTSSEHIALFRVFASLWNKVEMQLGPSLMTSWKSYTAWKQAEVAGITLFYSPPVSVEK